MCTTVLPAKELLLQQIANDQERYALLCADLIRCSGGHPPGDTTRGVSYVRDRLREQNIEAEVIEPRPGMQNLLAMMGDGDGPTVVLNAHLDVFPADDPALWQQEPFGGQITGDRIYGRGASDMKAGATASLAAFELLAAAPERIRGRLVLMLVADEETGGQWGTEYLLSTRDDLRVDACIIGEPSGTSVLRVGEKGQLWLELAAGGESYHAGLATGTEPIGRMARAITILQEEFIGRPGRIPNVLEPVLQNSRNYAWVPEFASRAWVLDHLSINFGTIEGGIKTNIAPRRCRATIDIRLPFGIDPDELTGEIRQRLADAELDIAVSPLLHRPCPGTFTAPDHALVTTAARNIESITGSAPDLIFNPTFTDARFFRIRDYPTIVYGPTPHGMAQPDEYVTIPDLITTIQVHTATAWDLLVGEPA